MEARAERYPEYWTELEVVVEHTGNDVDEVELRLALSGHEIEVAERGRSLPQLLEAAFDDLFRRFDAYRLVANRTLRERVEQRIGRARRVDAQMDDLLVRRLYPVLLRAAQHEIAVRQVEGDLEPGLVDPVEAADMVLADAWGELDPDVSEVDAAMHLEDRLLAVLDEIAEARHEHEEQDVSLNAEVPDGFAVSPEGEEIGDLWTLDEVAFEETVPDPEEDLEAIWQRQELRDTLSQALFQLPRDARRAFSQVVIDGWAPDALAAAQGRTLRAVLDEVDVAAHDLAHHLSRSGTAWSADRVKELYGALGERLRDERLALAATS